MGGKGVDKACSVNAILQPTQVYLDMHAAHGARQDMQTHPPLQTHSIFSGISVRMQSSLARR